MGQPNPSGGCGRRRLLLPRGAMAAVAAVAALLATSASAAAFSSPPRWAVGVHATTARRNASERKGSGILAANAIGDADGGADARRRIGETVGRAKQALALVAVSVSLVGPTPVEAAPLPPRQESRVAAVATPPGTGATLALAVATPTAPYTGELVDTTDAVLVRLEGGVTYRDLREGTKADGIASEGRRVNVQWVLKRSNGYSIDASANNDGVPFIFVVGSGRAIPGLDAGIRGMAVGGIRRIVIPPSMAYTGNLDDPAAPGPVPPGFGPRQRIKRVMENRRDVPDESFLLDIKLTRVQ